MDLPLDVWTAMHEARDANNTPELFYPSSVQFNCKSVVHSSEETGKQIRIQFSPHFHQADNGLSEGYSVRQIIQLAKNTPIPALPLRPIYVKTTYFAEQM